MLQDWYEGLLQIIYTFVRYLRNILVQEDETLSYIFAHPQSYVVSKNIDDKIELGVKIHKKINQFPFFSGMKALTKFVTYHKFKY